MAYDNNYSGMGCLRSQISSWSAGWGSGDNPLIWTIDASRISPVYSNDTDSLNPNSIKVLLMIRY